jgi:tetratricopeptide (TPR) repeat protein
LHAAGATAGTRGQYALAQGPWTSSSVARELGDAELLLEGHSTQALRLAHAAGDSWNVAMLLGQLGDVERMRGTHPRPAPLYQESIRLFQQLSLRDDPSRVHNLGYVALAEGRLERAAELFTDALRTFRRAGDQRGIADCMIGLGCVRSAERRPAEAA